MNSREVRIVVAEDDAVVARDIEETVAELGYTVSGVVGSGAAAVQTAKEDRPDLALLDIRMPGTLDGVGAGREIMRAFGIPVIFLTAYGDRDTVRRATLEGPFAYILKPFDARELGAAIEVALHHGDLERRLRASEERYASTLRSVREGVIATDVDGRVSFINPEAERLTGWNLDAVVGMDAEDVVKLHETEPHDDPRHAVKRVLADRESVTLTPLDLVHRDGHVTPVSDSMAPIIAPTGHLLGAVAVFRDETGAREQERQLRESEERFRQIAESIDDVFWISSLDKGRFDYVSPAFGRIWGLPGEELIENPELWLDRIVPEDRERVASSLPLQAAGGWQQEYRIRRPDGEIRWILDRAFPVEAAGGGEISKIAGVAQDVTVRRQAEERFSLLTEHVRDVVLVLDVHGRITFTSASVDEATGYSREVVQDSDLMDLVHPEDRAELRRQLTELAENPDEMMWTRCRILTRTGEERHLESIACNRLAHPGVEGIVMVSRDVTSRLALEGHLREAAKMEAVGRLAAGVAHDFNNLLTVIRAQADLLMIDLDPPDPIREEIELIASTASKAANLTAQLLAFGREQVLRPQLVNLNEIIEDMLPFLKKPLGSHVQIETSFSPRLSPIKIDKGHLEQVILNLALNARDALPSGGSLRLETEMVAPKEGATPTVRLHVSDDGIGMDAKTRDRIFEPFFTTKVERGGTGLGLASSYGIVLQSGGTMEVASEVGQGTTFILEFPVADEDVPGDTEPTASAPTPKKRDIHELLVVEDDSHVRHVVERTLVRDGYRVTVVENADTAIEVLRKEPTRFSAVLSDLMLQGTSARNLIDHMVTHHPDLPIIAMSGYADGSPGSRQDLPSAISFIQKPFTPDELRTIMRQATHHRRGLTSPPTDPDSAPGS